jgi:hypothetical protein
VSSAAAVAAVLATAAAAIWGFRVDPTPALRWFLVGTFLPALWAYVEFAQVRGTDPDGGADIMTLHRYTIAFAGFMLSSQIALRLMVHEGLMDPELLPTGQRLQWLAKGTGMVVFGNLLPTLKSPWPYRQQPFAWQQVHRFVGWLFVLGGFGVIASWTFLATESARPASLLICTIVFTLALVRKFASVATHAVGSH